MISVFLANFTKSLAMKRDRIQHELIAKRWKILDPDLNTQIVPQAMKLLVQQLYLAKDTLVDKPCTSSFEQINGIPCYHTIRVMERLELTITRADFHKHWHFDRPGEAIQLPVPPAPPQRPNIFAPHVVITRGRPREDRSTRRIPSQFEATAVVRRRRPGRVGGEISRVGTFASSIKESS
jgi:hypothetical protein